MVLLLRKTREYNFLFYSLYTYIALEILLKVDIKEYSITHKPGYAQNVITRERKPFRILFRNYLGYCFQIQFENKNSKYILK